MKKAKQEKKDFPNGELILYTTEDGTVAINLQVADGTVWLTQLELSELFQTSKQNISLHVRNVLAEGELRADSVVKEYLTTAADGKRYRTRSYNLEMILAVGYRVRSVRGTQFRQWATTRLREFLVKGFVMDDARLKSPSEWDYFDELLARIREIRASEKRFYQKVRDLYATAVDYDGKSETAQIFFSKVQNMMLWAVTGQTAAELISGRADPSLLNMGLQSFSGNRVRKRDVVVAKNYLQKDEIEELDRIVVMYLDYAEDQARRRKTVTMHEWEEKLETFLTLNERDLLTHAGKVRADFAEKLVHERYEVFDAKRRLRECEKADAEDLDTIESLQQRLPGDSQGGKKS